MIDIIIFGIIAFVLAYRLYNLLGATDEFNPNELKGQVIDLDVTQYKEKQPVNTGPSEEDILLEEKLTKTALASLNKVKKIDQNFSLAKFLVGSEKAFEMVIEAFSSGDKKTLNLLTEKDIAKRFYTEFERQKKQDHKINISLVGIESSKISKIELDGSVVTISVKFLSEQISVVKDKSGKVISGNEKNIEEINDHWFFTKDLKNKSPIWVVTKTES